MLGHLEELLQASVVIHNHAEVERNSLFLFWDLGGKHALQTPLHELSVVLARFFDQLMLKRVFEHGLVCVVKPFAEALAEIN
jgi:hypothetical protein